MTFKELGKIIAKDFDFALDNANWEKIEKNENVYNELIDWRRLSGKYFNFDYVGLRKNSKYKQYSIEIKTIPNEVYSDKIFTEWLRANIHDLSVLIKKDKLLDSGIQEIYPYRVIAETSSRSYTTLYEWE